MAAAIAVRMCYGDRSREQHSPAEEKIPDEETVLDETPSRERPAKGIVDIPVRTVKRVKALLST